MRWLLFFLLLIPLAWAEEVPVRAASGNSYVPVRLNEVITLEMAIDTGASQVCVPEEIFQLLRNGGTVSKADLGPVIQVKLADGSVRKSQTFYLRKLTLGSTTLERVPAMVSGKGGSLLLGQSALKLLPNWRLDLQRDLLVFGGRSSPATLDLANRELVMGLYQALLESRVQRLQADYERQVQRKLPPRLLVLQETLDKCSQLCLDSDSKVTDPWRPIFLQIQALIERSKSIVSLKVRAAEGEKVAERLAALEELFTQENEALSRLFSESKLEAKDAALLLGMVRHYPDLKFSPGEPYAGVYLMQLEGSTKVLWTFAKSPAAEAGVEAGFTLLSVDGQPVSSPKAAQSALGQLGSHRLEVLTREGEHRTLKLETRKFVPFGARSLSQFILVPRGNASVSTAAEKIFGNALIELLRQRARPEHLVYVYVLSDLREAPVAEIFRRYRTDYVILFDIESWQIATSNIFFRGKVRRANCRVNLGLYASGEAPALLQENYEAIVDELASGSEPTFDLCKHRLMEKVEAGLKAVLPAPR